MVGESVESLGILYALTQTSFSLHNPCMPLIVTGVLQATILLSPENKPPVFWHSQGGTFAQLHKVQGEI